jgi:hypothetical protein
MTIDTKWRKKMTKGKNTTVCILLMFLLAAFAGNILAGERMTIVGVVTDDGLIVDKKGVIYEIGENDNFEGNFVCFPSRGI